MSTRKVSVDTVREEMRMLNETANTTAETGVGNWLSSDFWTMAGSSVTNLVAVAVLIGWVNNTQAAGLTQALTAVIGATQVIVVNAALVWKYLSNRNQLRAAILSHRYHYLEATTIEKMRLTAQQ
jgi:uncharacterized membrane protein